MADPGINQVQDPGEVSLIPCVLCTPEPVSGTTWSPETLHVDLTSESTRAANENQLRSEYDSFVFPVAMDDSCLDGRGPQAPRCVRRAGKSTHSVSVHWEDEEEGDDTDSEEFVPSGAVTSLRGQCLGPICQSKIFTDAATREKWKDRGWRAAQCCGGTLPV